MTDLLTAIRQHRSVAMAIARAWRTKLPANVLLEDLEQAAMIGLFEWKRSHPDEGAQGWIQGLKIRISGSIKDELRRQDWLPRPLRREQRAKAEPLRIVGCTDANPQWEDQWAGRSDSPEHVVACRQEVEFALGAPSERDAKIIRLMFFRGLQQSEVGARLGCSDPRVSQCYSRALAKMRARLLDESPARPARPADEAARCIDCAQPPAKDRARCAACAKAHNASEAARRERRKARKRAKSTEKGSTPMTDFEPDSGIYQSHGAEPSPVPSTLPEEGIDLRAELTRYQNWLVAQALLRTDGNRAAAAKLLGLKRTTLAEMLKSGSLVRLVGGEETPPAEVPAPEPPAPAEPTPPPPVEPAPETLPETPAAPAPAPSEPRIPARARRRLVELYLAGKTIRQTASIIGLNYWQVEREFSRLADEHLSAPRKRAAR